MDCSKSNPGPNANLQAALNKDDQIYQLRKRILECTLENIKSITEIQCRINKLFVTRTDCMSMSQILRGRKNKAN